MQTPGTYLGTLRVVERADGWVAAWYTDDALVVERSLNGALAWATRKT